MVVTLRRVFSVLVAIGFMVLIAASVFSVSYSTKSEREKELVECEKAEERLYETVISLRNSYPSFMKIAEQVARENEYDSENYNCKDFTNELVKRLKEAGYEAEYESVNVNCESGMFTGERCEETSGAHALTKVEIYIESTSGKIITPSDYKDYGIRDDE